MILLETKRLILRNVIDEDAAVMFDYRNNPICARYQRGQSKDLPGIVALIDKRKNDLLTIEAPCLLAVALKETDDMVGEIVVMPNEQTFSLGYTFSYKHHRKGYAFEAVSALLNLLHSSWPDWEFICFTDPKNAASMGLLTKLGYQNYGYLSSKDSQVFGKWITDDTTKELTEAVEK